MAAVSAAIVASCSVEEAKAPPSRAAAPDVSIEVLSTRPDMVSGGDVLVAVTGGKAGDRRLFLNDTDVTDRLDGQGVAYLDGLREGANRVTVRDGDRTVGELEVVNHPITGPIFSGPHQTPFACTTEVAGLGPPTDEDCSAPTRVTWAYYRASDAPSAVPTPLPDPTVIPEDVAMVDRDGTKVPFVLRIEKGVIDRSIYEFTVLEPKPDPSAPPRTWDRSAWNGVLLYRYGGGCGTGYHQGRFLGAEPIDRTSLAEGFANVESTLNVFQTACNDVLSAEVTMMVREHLIETYGLPRYVIGLGGSGGAIQVQLIAQNYPGLLDAIGGWAPFPDAVTIAAGVSDCGLLARFWETPEGATFDDAQRLAVQGHGSLDFCRSWRSLFLRNIDPDGGCAGDVPVELRYDPQRNPRGARCTLQDSTANLLPEDPSTGFAQRPLDNVGIQYGLVALRDGVISVEQFLDLNEAIGGYDLDGNIVPERESASLEVVRAAYAKGRVLHGDGDLRRIPFVSVNLYTDLGNDIHDRFRAFGIRDRMTLDGRRPTNHVIWTRPGRGLSELGRTVPEQEIVGLLVEWLESLSLDRDDPGDDAGWQAKLGRTRPSGLTDDCVTPDGVRLASLDVYDRDNACTAAYPIHGDPRTAAGMPRRNDVVKCQLVAVDPESYGVPFTPQQVDRLRRIFPDGVCDPAAPSQGAAPLEGTWLRY